MPERRRTRPPRQVEKRVYQEAGSRCAYCPEATVASLQIHHIDGDPLNHVFENLLLVCANCHTKITAGTISATTVRDRKRLLMQAGAPPVSMPAVSVSINASQFQGDIAQTITKIATGGRPRIKHPDGSLGADLSKKGYIDYLIARYFEYRQADTSYGRHVAFSHGVLHKSIQRKFGHKTFFMPVEFFPQLVNYLHQQIDKTIQGKRNTKRGIPNYHTFNVHLIEHDHSAARR
ncbi:MAG: HNH endonuclease [Phycisphaerae bacterium]|nr:HNH endonuclease [Phycisphaerae bacterium]